MSDNEYNDENQDENQEEYGDENQEEEQQQDDYENDDNQEEEQQDDNNDEEEQQQDDYQQEDDNKQEEEPEPEPEPEPEQEEEEEQQQSYTSGEVPSNLDLDSAWEIICKDNPSLNWYAALVTKKQQLEFQRAGNGGLKELSQYLTSQSSNIILALLRVNSNDKGGSKRAKFVFAKFIGSKVPFMQKAKLTPNLGRLCDRFPVKHLTFDVTDDLANFSEKILVKEFLRVGGAHKPDSYDFGPGQVHKV